MKRTKKLLGYGLVIIIFWILSEVLINIGLNTTYKKMQAKSTLPQVNIIRAESTQINGRIYGEIDLAKNSDLIGKYLKINLYSKRDILLGIDYIKIEKSENEDKQTIEKYFKYNEVNSYDLSIIEETQKNKEIEENTDKSLFEGFSVKEMALPAIIWSSFIMIALTI